MRARLLLLPPLRSIGRRRRRPLPPSPSPVAAAAPVAAELARRGFRSSNRPCASSSSNGSDPPSGGQPPPRRPPPTRPTPAGTFVWRDVQYHSSHSEAAADGASASSSDPRKHQLDVYVAAAPFPRPPQPVLIFVHGGLWVRGDRQHPAIPTLYENVGAACARAGMVGVVISYRLAPHVQHPEQCRDVARALRWAHAHAPRFGGDPTALFLAGASAGAHLCTTLLASPRLLEEEGLVSSSSSSVLHALRGVVGLSGVYNLERLMHQGGGALATASLLPAVFGDDPSRWPGASPTHLLRAHLAASASPSQLLPLQRTPLLLLNAAADFHLAEDTAELLGLLEEGEKRGKGAGVVPRAAHVVPGTDHISLVRDVGKEGKGKDKGGEVDALVFGFIRRTLAAAAAGSGKE